MELPRDIRNSAIAQQYKRFLERKGKMHGVAILLQLVYPPPHRCSTNS